jgi:hypothetical protein
VLTAPSRPTAVLDGRPPAPVAPAEAKKDHRPRWWREVLIVLVSYGLYSVIRNWQGKETDQADYQRALANAQHIIGAERFVGLYHERAVQSVFLKVPELLRALDSFWAMAHFLVTAAVLVWLIRWHPNRYRPLRTGLALATAGGLLCFALFPTLPPRLLPDSYGFVDSWVRVGGIAAHHPPRIERISDPFAAMPSLHIAWAVWCAAAVAPAMKRIWTKAVAYAYPVVTFVAVVATGNHFVLDAVAGLVLAVAALAIARRPSREPAATH